MTSRRVAVAWLSAFLAVAGCTSGGGEITPIDPDGSAPPADDGPVAEPPEAEPAPGPVSAEDEIAEVWAEFFVAFHEQGTLDEPDPGLFEGSAADPEAAAMAAVSQPGGVVVLETEFWPEVEVSGGEAQLEDCVLTFDHLVEVDEEEAEHRSTGWSAVLVETDDGWRVEGASQVGAGQCVPSELNDQLLAAYDRYRETLNEVSDPNDPRLEQVAVGEHLDSLREVRANNLEAGVELRDPAPTDDAVVFRLEIGFGVVSDCTEQVPEFGAFDVETGERIEDVTPTVAEGRIDAQSVELVRGDDDQWRVLSRGVTRDTDCDIGGTDLEVR